MKPPWCDLCSSDEDPLTWLDKEWLCPSCRDHTLMWNAMTPAERERYFESMHDYDDARESR